MDTTQHLADLDAKLAAIESDIVYFTKRIAQLPRWNTGVILDAWRAEERELRRRVVDLTKQHEQLVARVQRWTVGASRGMEVL